MAPYELAITRLIDAPRERIFAAWTDPEQLKQWFAPQPITTPECEMDPRPGGIFRTLMRGEDGTEYPGTGVFLEVVAPERIVFTDAFLPGWIPAEKPFMTAIITMEEEEGKTRYTARVRHWNEEDLKQHEAMNFHEGWGTCIDQLVTLVARPD